ncbi:MAG: glycosyltransferase family 39 protein [Bacteroidales bacterium]|nr:glycosyltransferase family 39 protein [Bacteroidales bacterium]
MLTFFPKQIARNGVVTYLVALAAVAVIFPRFLMPLGFILLGLGYILLFFLLSNSLTRKWNSLTSKDFAWHVFLIGLLLRVMWLSASYFYYSSKYGIPFEQLAMDALNYHLVASEWTEKPDLQSLLWVFFNAYGLSDSGYLIYLTTLYFPLNCNIFLARLCNAALSALTPVLIYRLGSRVMGEKTGRMAAIFCMLCPNFIHYCGLHLKENVMLCLEVAFLERTDYLLRKQRVSVFVFIEAGFFLVSLFLFRTVLGAVAVLSLITCLMFSERRFAQKYRKFFMVVWFGLFAFYAAESPIASEVETYWEERGENTVRKRNEQTLRGNLWAKYATSAVMLPMIFVLPYSTMVEVPFQEEQLFLHAGNFVRNFLGIFALIALYVILFKHKNWKAFTLVGTFLVEYLVVVGLSGFSNSERFLLPAYPLLLLFSAHGIANLDARTFQISKFWCVIVVLMEVAWAYFKLGSRGLV